MTKSSVVDNETGKSMDSTVRTSTGTFFARGQDEVLTSVEKRIAQVGLQRTLSLFSSLPTSALLEYQPFHTFVWWCLRSPLHLATHTVAQAVWCYCMMLPVQKAFQLAKQNAMQVSHIPEENGEGMQVLHYVNGQKYEPHHDYFHDTVNPQKSNGGQRVATMLMYLTTVDEGGETVFPNSAEKVTGDQWSDCA